jgi:integrase
MCIYEPAAGAELGHLKVRARHSKNSKSRNVPLTARVVEMLKNLRPHKAGYVFHRSHGQPVYQTWLNQQHSDLRALLKLPTELVPHSFRHTYGTRLGESGADAFTIRQLMGHSSVTVSQKYVHPTPETVERAVQRLEKLNQGKAAKELEEPKMVATKVATAKEAKVRKC